MAKQTSIAWCKSSWNCWIGCTPVSEGCNSCYAEALDVKRFSKIFDGGTKEKPISHWGAGAPRHRTSASNWKAPLMWNKAAPDSEFAGRKGFWPVFCASLADVFDNEVPDAWRFDLWNLVEWTQNLTWYLVTKRIGNVKHMVPSDWYTDSFPPNVRIIVTIVNQEEADRDIPKLLALRCKNGISYEPGLGPVDWWQIPVQGTHGDMHDMQEIGWIIVGGESAQVGHEARPFMHRWAKDTVAQCRDSGVPVFVKQMGSNAVNREGDRHEYKDHAGADPAEWSSDLQVREFPR